MISDSLQIWMVVIVIFLGAVFSQMPMMAMPYGPYGPMMMPAPPPPMAMPVPVPMPIPIPYPESTTTTTTTTISPANEAGNEDGAIRIPIAIPMPMPQFVQFAIPGFDPQNCQNGDSHGNKNGNGGDKKSCPPCPPCTCNPCTPSFFAYCSPCHQQCRCKQGQQNPIPQDPQHPKPLPGPAFPMPLPIPGPPPVVIVPFPPQFGDRQPSGDTYRQIDSDCESRFSKSESHYDDDSCESHESRNRKRKRKRGKKNEKKGKYGIYRRNYGFVKRTRDNNDGLVQPVLSYMTRDGKIKIKRRLSNDEADSLLGQRDLVQNVRLLAGKNSNDQPRVVVMSQPNMRSGHRRRQILLREGVTQHKLDIGRKELVFRPPNNKKISNLSVSFQVEK